MRKMSVLVIAASLSVGFAIAQGDATKITKEQFIAMYENAIKSKSSNSTASMAEEMMRKNLSPDQFADWKKSEKSLRQEENKIIANCAGISLGKFNELEEKITPSVQLSLFKQCSDKLPNSISLGSLGMDQSPELSEFNACVESLASKKFGVSIKKLETCRLKVEDEGFDEGDY